MSTDSVSSLRQRMIEDMNARKLCAGTQRGHIRSCKQFAAFLKRSPDTATSEDIRRFQLHLAESSASICNRNRIMTGLRFLFRVTLRRLDLAAEIERVQIDGRPPYALNNDDLRDEDGGADERQPEMNLPEKVGIGTTSDLGEQVVPAGEDAEQRGPPEPVGHVPVLVAHSEVGVMNRAVCADIGQRDDIQSTRRGHDDEANCPKHRAAADNQSGPHR